MEKYLKKARAIIDFQFGKNVGEKFFPDEVEIELGSTKKIRRIYLDNKLLASLRPRDGFFTLSYFGAKRLHQILEGYNYRVKIYKKFVPLVALGYNVMANYIFYADENILPKEEVIIIDELGRVIGVGEALLNGEEMSEFNYGIAIKVRKTIKNEMKEKGLWNSNWSEELKKQKVLEYLESNY
jgi:predicted RNA-binding protein (TIGR00451 family)